MTGISLRKLLVAAIFASLVGSTIGTALLLFDEIFGHPLRRFMGAHFANASEPIGSYILIYPVVWMISLCGTLPGSILIGVPAIYPVRNQIVHRPLLSLIPIALYAVLLFRLDNCPYRLRSKILRNHLVLLCRFGIGVRNRTKPIIAISLTSDFGGRRPKPARPLPTQIRQVHERRG